MLGIWHNVTDGTVEMEMGRGCTWRKDNMRFDIMYQCKTQLLWETIQGNIISL